MDTSRQAIIPIAKDTNISKDRELPNSQNRKLTMTDVAFCTAKTTIKITTIRAKIGQNNVRMIPSFLVVLCAQELLVRRPVGDIP